MSVSRKALLGASTLAAVIGAAPIQARPPETERHSIMSVATLSFYDTYQLKNPPVGSLLNGILFNNRHNSPALQLGSLDLGWKSDDGRLALTGSFIAGDIADELHGGSSSYLALRGESRYKNIGQAFGTVHLGERGAIDIGKFYSELSMERPEPWKNDFLSNSSVYEILPKYHAGVRVAYPLGSASNLSVQAGLVNALFNSDRVGVRSNKGDVDGYLGVRYQGGDPMGAHWSGAAHYGWGDESLGSVKRDLSLIDLGIRYDLKSGARAGLDYANIESKISGKDKTNGVSLSYGQPFGSGFLRGRYDWLQFDPFSGPTDRRTSVTLDFDRPLCENALWRTEVRHDTSKFAFFMDGEGSPTRKSQDVISTGVFFSTDAIDFRNLGPNRTLVFPSGDRFQINGGFSGYYQYSANTPESGLVNGRVFDLLHSTPSVNLAELNVGLPAKEGGFGFRSTWITGDIADKIHYAYAGNSSGEARFKNVGQFYGTYDFNQGTARLGKFFTPFGQERIEPWRNAFSTHSNLFLELPRYHFGVDAQYDISGAKGVTLQAALVNSLINTPNYGVKPHSGYSSWFAGIDYQPNYVDDKSDEDDEDDADDFGLYRPTHLRGRVLFGSGRNPDSGYMSTRSRTELLNFQGYYPLTEQRGIGVEYLRRTDKPDTGTRTTANGWSATYCHPLGEGTLRGRIDGLENKFGSTTDRVTSYTIGYERPFCDAFSVRPELRLDTANRAVFSRQEGQTNKKNQLTLAIGAFYKFSK